MQNWDAGQYLKFEAERTQLSRDLAARITVEQPGKIIDMGCGPGNSTRVLARRFPGAAVCGVDSSPEMIAAAQAAFPQFAFQQLDISGDLEPLGNGYDVVFSNACIQWVPGHAVLIPKLMALLRPGGQLAVQTPMIEREPIHQMVQAVAGAARWQGRFGGGRSFYNLSPEAYHALLAATATGFWIWETIYHHRMPSHAAILEWYRGSGLRPYLQVLTPEERIEFEDAILERLLEAYPLQPNGEIIFRFPRLFFLAVR
ncbi:MAG: methyltransferase domain-containing protein [Ruminococcaceae bacterium]|nr:methyltransferase domain-containing protein [Oscillospiraceae bacterium]